MLDFYAEDERNVLAGAAGRLAEDLPATFGETFDQAVRTAQEFGNSNGYWNSRYRVVEDYIQGVRAKTGQDLSLFNDLAGGPDEALLGELNAKIDELNAADTRLELPRLPPDELDKQVLARMASARAAAAAMARREKTFGGSVGGLIGDFAGALDDPVNMAMMPLGVAGRLGILGRAVEGGILGAAGQVANEAYAGETRERAVPGSRDEAMANVGMAAAGGAVLGGAFAAFGRIVGMIARDTPTALREDLSAAASDAQLEATNVLPGIAGEVAHRDAVPAAMRQVLNGEPVTAADLVPGGLRVAVDEPTPKEAIEAMLRDTLGGEIERHATLSGVLERNRAALAELDRELAGPEASAVRRAAIEIEQIDDTIARLRDSRERAGAKNADAIDARIADLERRQAETWRAVDPALAVRLDEATALRAARADNVRGAEVEFRDLSARIEAARAEARERYWAERKLRPITFDEPLDMGGDVRFALPPEAATPAPAPDAAGLRPGEVMAAPLRETRESVARLVDDPAVAEGILRDMDRLRLEKPDLLFGERVVASDGTVGVVERRLDDVLDGLDRREAVARELEACVIGMDGGAAALAARAAL